MGNKRPVHTLVVLVAALAVAAPAVGTVAAASVTGAGSAADATRQTGVDLALSLTAGDVDPGGTVQVTFTVENRGSSAASGASLQARFPRNWTVEGHTDDGGQFAARGVGWRFETVDPGGTRTVTVTIRVPERASGNDVSLRAQVGDRDRNTASAESTIVVGDPDDESGGDGSGSDGSGGDAGGSDDDGGGLSGGGDSDDGSSSDGDGTGEDGREADGSKDGSTDDSKSGSGDGSTDDSKSDSVDGSKTGSGDGNATNESTTNGTAGGSGDADEGSSDDGSNANGGSTDDAGGNASHDPAGDGEAARSSDDGAAAGDAAAAAATSMNVADVFGLDDANDGFDPLSALDQIATPVEDPRRAHFDGVFSLFSVGAIGVLVSRRFR